MSRLKQLSFLVVCALCAATPARADLVAHWTFDGNVLDSTANGNNGTLNGPTFSNEFAPFLGSGQSLSFAGGTQHVLVPDSSSLDLASAITITSWVKPVGNVAWDGILAKSPSGGSDLNQAGNYEFRVENGTRQPTFHHQRGGLNDTAAYAGTAPVAQGTWQHLAVTASNGGSINFYVNGVGTGSAAVNGMFGAVNNNPLYIGTRADLFTTMNGLLDDVRIYNNVLSPAAIYQQATGIDPGAGYDRIGGVLARASSEFADGRVAAGAVNGNGLVGRFHVNNPPQGNMWLSAAGDVAPTFEIDLGGTYSVDDLRVWNYNENANPTCCMTRGVERADIYVAGADGVYGAAPVAQNVAFNIAPGTLTDFSQVVGLGGVQARYVKLAVAENHGDESFTGLSEVQVAGSAVAGKAPLPATIESVSSNIESPFNRNAAHLLNRTGIGFGDSHSIVPDGTMWLSQGTFNNTLTPDHAPEVTFDLGEVTALASMKVWNYNETLAGREDELLNRGVAFANILVAGEDMVFSLKHGFVEFARAPGAANVDFSQSIPLGVEARYVKIQVLANHHGRDFTDPEGTDGLSNFAGLAEVQFFGVPEPSSVVLAALGACGLLATARRRFRAKG